MKAKLRTNSNKCHLKINDKDILEQTHKCQGKSTVTKSDQLQEASQAVEIQQKNFNWKNTMSKNVSIRTPLKSRT